METTCLIQESQKKQKLNEEDQDICLAVLPEEILRHILSFLPTKDAVRTSVLSKSWEYRWVSIPNLDFHRAHWELPWPAEKTLLMNFVERVLCLRDSYNIKRFNIAVPCDASRVNTWISAAVRHNVQELYISLDNFNGEFSLPYCLFTCKTLTSLRLRMFYILKLPTTICFSNLKTLTIEEVTFSDEYLIEQLFYGMPVLEDLQLESCSWAGLKYVVLSAPKLRCLSIVEWEMPDWSYENGCQVLFYAVNLIEFNYYGELHADYSIWLCWSFSLENAEIRSLSQINAIPESDNISAQISRRMYRLLIGLSNVKTLTLSSQVVEVLIDAAEHLSHMLMFNNLADLVFCEDEGSGIDLDWVGLWMILQNSPCLKTMTFFEGISLRENDDWKLDPLPSCFLSHLKWIGVYSFYGSMEQLFAVKILLKNAVVLDEIVISCSYSSEGNLEEQENLYKQLIEIPKGSQNCKIILL